MDSIRYTAAGRLGLWDAISHNREEFLSEIKNLLESYSHAVLETEEIQFIPTDNPVIASVISICDKIVARGNPTLVDLDFELALLEAPDKELIAIEEFKDGPSVGTKLLADYQNIGLLTSIISAAREILQLPYRSHQDCISPMVIRSSDLRAIASEEEDLFVQQFEAAFGPQQLIRLHRQVLIRDLIDEGDEEFIQNRVDFAFQQGPIKWVFEVDGVQHEEEGQKAKDRARDDLLKKKGWKVFRIQAHDVRSGLSERFENLKSRMSENEVQALKPSIFSSAERAVAESAIHSAALQYLILPHAFHRCLRGLLQLFSYGVLDPFRSQRILIIEEDLPVTVEAFRALHSLWDGIHILAPEIPKMPKLKIDVIGSGGISKRAFSNDMEIRSLSEPDGIYDIIISNSFFLRSSHVGKKEAGLFAIRPENLVSFRRAVGYREERELQWCEALHYDLSDLEKWASNKEDRNPLLKPLDKYNALVFFLRLIFRKRDFWDGQVWVISRILQGKPAIVLLPTGGGKSLTYQLSGLLLPGMTVIIDPLISLMADQVENLNASGIDLVKYLSSSLEPEKKDAVCKDMEKGRLALIFISPERLQVQDFRIQLQSVVSKFPVSLVVVDEVHCISEWGHDFRTSYLHMPQNLVHYCSDKSGRSPTIVGLTGTASFAVLTDIQMEMHITDEEAIILPLSFDRKELKFNIIQTPMATKPAALKTLKMQIPRILRSNPQEFFDIKGDRTNSGIVFCPHVGGSLGVTTVAGLLGHNNFFSGKIPKYFQGDLAKWNLYKTQTQQAFKRNKIQELVATKSFGMGIDKPNIRYTIHYSVPQSVEAFYQEAGRAGRNGIRNYALCTILYSDDNWDAALDILNESDHPEALRRLNGINWNDRGDLLVQLWLLFSSYQGREQEKALILKFWNDKLAPVVKGMPQGATNTQEIAFNRDKGSSRDELAIFRLMLLGVVKDYTINWQTQRFAVKVQRKSAIQVKESLRDYLMQYKFRDFADTAVSKIDEDNLGYALPAAINVLIDFIYDEIVLKRKQALRTMGELCRNFTSDQEFREAILAYLQESEFTDELKGWINRGIDDVGMDSIHNILDRVTSLEEVKRLVGTARRMLDEDPKNIALRYLSMCARAQSSAESETSVIQEAITLAIQIDGLREGIHNADMVAMAALNAIAEKRPALLEKVGDIFLRKAGSLLLARMILSSPLSRNRLIYHHSLKLLMAEILNTVRKNEFISGIREEEYDDGPRQNY